MDELGRLKSFRQGLFENGQWDENALTAQHEWKLDEQGNWREHREEPANSFLTTGLDIVNAYTNWPVPFDNDGDGTTATVEDRNTCDSYVKAVSMPSWQIPDKGRFSLERQPEAAEAEGVPLDLLFGATQGSYSEN